MSSAGTQTILYVEDDENDIIFLRMAFKSAGIVNPLFVVSDGQLAIDYLKGVDPYEDRKKFPLPRLVLLDMKLPKKTGIDVLQWTRSMPRFSTLPVLMLTSSDREMDIRSAYTNGANGYLVKPCTPNEQLVMARAIKDYWLGQNKSLG